MNENDLQHITQQYWEYEAGLDERLRWYILRPHEQLGNKSLLEAELAEAERRGNLKAKPCTTLVLLVGHSLEPLLQSVCIYKPEKIVLLLNEKPYPVGPGKRPKKWYAYAEHFVEAVQILTEQHWPHCTIEWDVEFPGETGYQGYPVEDNPDAVFQKLVEVLKDEQDVVIDVTGGKKSMVSGAYMYAAYAGTRISYVDFDEYDPEYRRPYGYTCKIGDGLSNPYEAFALREWERVRSLYERYQFREAKQILDGEIRPAMAKWPQNATEAVDLLSNILLFYALWDSGNYREANELLDTLPSFKPPDAVTRLGPGWYEFQNDQVTHTPRHFYGTVRNVQVYVCDELARINRLIECNEDYRSAFLRAAGLNEVVLVARLVDYADSSIQPRLLDVLDMETPSARKLFRSLANNTWNLSWRFLKDDTKSQFGNSLNVPLTKQMDNWWSNTSYQKWEDFLDYRNKLAHTYFSVPKKWAQDALAFVQANVEDFWGPIANMKVHTEALPWPELCELTGVAAFLPPNLRKEA